jgi:hypothetical protein
MGPWIVEAHGFLDQLVDRLAAILERLASYLGERDLRIGE